MLTPYQENRSAAMCSSSPALPSAPTELIWAVAFEGACRHLIGDRLEITGARWGLDGAEAILKLRALNDNGDLDTYWTFHLAQEHERLYSTPDQHDYHLTA